MTWPSSSGASFTYFDSRNRAQLERKNIEPNANEGIYQENIFFFSLFYIQQTINNTLGLA